MTSKMLVPIDGSRHSEVVLGVAADLARARGAEIVLMHVIPHLSVPTDFAHYLEHEHLRQPPVALYEESVGKNLLDEFKIKAEAMGVQVSLRATSGSAASEIVEAATEIQADMIVLGTHGVGGLSRVLGGVAQKVSSAAPCTLIMVQ